jgi:hypothetical protein
MGIIGKRRESDFSFEVSILFSDQYSVAGGQHKRFLHRLPANAGHWTPATSY